MTGASKTTTASGGRLLSWAWKAACYLTFMRRRRSAEVVAVELVFEDNQTALDMLTQVITRLDRSVTS